MSKPGSNGAADQFEGDIGRALDGAAVGIGLFEKVNREAMPAATDFRERGVAGWQQDSDELMGRSTVEATLEKTLHGDFRPGRGALANQPKK